MDILDIIAKKRDKGTLSRDEIHFFIKNYVDGSIKDYQASALLMAIYLNGMNNEEISILTDEMMHSDCDIKDCQTNNDKHPLCL